MRLRGSGNRSLGFGAWASAAWACGLGLAWASAASRLLRATASIALALSLPLLASLGVLAIFLAVAFVPPSASSLAALRTAISSLGTGGAKGFFAVLE